MLDTTINNIGLRLLKLTGYLVLLGGVLDIAMTFYLNSLPSTHLEYLELKDQLVPVRLINLDHSLLRALGGCLIGTGVGALTIIYGSQKNLTKYSIGGIVAMVSLAEGINAIQMILIKSPYFIFPFFCVVMTWTGALLWWVGHKKGAV